MQLVPKNHHFKKFICSGLVLAAGFSLVACSSEAEPINSTSSKPTSSSSAKTSATVSPIPTPSETAFVFQADSQDKSCSQILTPQALYELDPNLITGNSPSSPAGSYAQQASSLGGTGCTIFNTSTKQEIQVFVTKLTAPSGKQMTTNIESLKSSAKTYEASIGVTGIYSADSTVGTAQFMNKNYWVVIAEPLPGGNVNTAKLSNLIYTALQ